MARQSFVKWLNNEVTSCGCILLKLYEELDKLIYIDGPKLEKEYMDKIGNFEEKVIKEEIECELLKKKQELIQSAINRREPIDEAKIDEEIDRLRQEKLKEACGDEPQEYADLPEEQENELQEIYGKIIKFYHPQTHPDLTDAHKELFEKAQEVYRRRDLSALKLIYDMLISIDGEKINIDLLKSMLDDSVEIECLNDEGLATDYTLASVIFNNFVPTSEEAAIHEEWTRYKQKIDEVTENVEKLKLQFPYSAMGMLSDPRELEQYKTGLEHRLYIASNEISRLTDKIKKMKEESMHNGKNNAGVARFFARKNVQK